MVRGATRSVFKNVTVPSDIHPYSSRAGKMCVFHVVDLYVSLCALIFGRVFRDHACVENNFFGIRTYVIPSHEREKRKNLSNRRAGGWRWSRFYMVKIGRKCYRVC